MFLPLDWTQHIQLFEGMIIMPYITRKQLYMVFICHAQHLPTLTGCLILLLSAFFGITNSHTMRHNEMKRREPPPNNLPFLLKSSKTGSITTVVVLFDNTCHSLVKGLLFLIEYLPELLNVCSRFTNCPWLQELVMH